MCCAAFGLKRKFPDKFHYKVLKILDFPTENIYRYFEETSRWISEAIKYRGRVFVDCLADIYHSSSIMIEIW